MLAAVMAVVTLAALSGCSLLPAALGGGSSSKYHVTVYFTKAVAFYPRSQVQVMGVPIGTVDSVTPVNGKVKVVASIDRDIPLPANARAAIVPLSLIGERTLTFSPSWKPGAPKLADGAVLDTDRSQVPVEVDQALQAFTTLLQAFNPAAANKVLHKSSQSFQGNGAAFNAALQQSADLTANIAGQDKQLLEVARNLHRIAGVVAGRQKALGTLISSFSQVSADLASERQNIETFIVALASLVRRGDVLIKSYQGQLVQDLGRIAQITLVVKGNAQQLGEFLKTLTPLNYMLSNATNHKDHALTLRLALNNIYRSYLAAALKQPTVNPKAKCLPEPYSNCPWEK
ncbi:MCE family protein [Actinomadura scrupuli]|uniref:MCE family protein n=1 Tax=Actinomadura scrupuli TaxID=559629 RepID=UPI003D98F6C6